MEGTGAACPLEKSLAPRSVVDTRQVRLAPQIVLEAFGHHHAGQLLQLRRLEVAAHLFRRGYVSGMAVLFRASH